MVISVEAIRYLGDNVVVVREWDGYDQVQKIPVFKITEEELDFKGGRFTRCNYSAAAALKQPIKKAAFATDQYNLKEIIEWIDKNTEGFWNFDISDNFNECFVNGDYYWHVWIFWFKDDEDYVKFVLRWE